MFTSLGRLLILPRILLTLSVVRHTINVCAAIVLLPVCLQAPSLYSRAAPQPVFLSFLVGRRKVILSSLMWDFAFVLAIFSVKVPAGMADQPSSMVTGPSHILVFSAKLITKHYTTSSRLLIAMIRDKTAFWGTPPTTILQAVYDSLTI